MSSPLSAPLCCDTLQSFLEVRNVYPFYMVGVAGSEGEVVSLYLT